MPKKSNHPIPSTPTSEVTVAFQNPTQSSSTPENQNNPNDSHSHSPPSSNACAACKFQRRKCVENCPLTPYFPANKQEQFINAYKLFGVNNIVKTLNSVPPEYRDDAMTSLIYTANVRAKDPVGGCLRIVQYLQARIESYNKELNDVRAQIAALRTAALLNHPSPFIGDDRLPLREEFPVYNIRWVHQKYPELNIIKLRVINVSKYLVMKTSKQIERENENFED